MTTAPGRSQVWRNKKTGKRVTLLSGIEDGLVRGRFTGATLAFMKAKSLRERYEPVHSCGRMTEHKPHRWKGMNEHLWCDGPPIVEGGHESKHGGFSTQVRL